MHAGLIAVTREVLTRQVAPRFFVDSIDLQEATDLLYARYRYDLGIDYTEDPPPPLCEADLAWERARAAAWREARDT